MAEPDFQAWLRETLAFYRGLGFFDSSPDELADQLAKELLADAEGRVVDLVNPALDLAVLSYDTERCVLDTPNVGELLAPNNDVYVKTLQQLAKISRGYFRPQELREDWKTPQGPVTIEFKQDGQTRTLVANDKEGKLDPILLLQLNLSIYRSGYQFELVQYSDERGDFFFVTTLTQDERFSIERQRRVPFVIVNLQSLFGPLKQLGAALPPAATRKLSGTVNEFMDRSVGRLELEILEDGQVQGNLDYVGEEHEEALTFRGTHDLVSDVIEGTIEGRVNTRDQGWEDYLGTWQGSLDPGGKVATGFWRGWLAELSSDEPGDATLVNVGEWATVDAQFLQTDEPHLKRVKNWLEKVWTTQDPELYPWTLPPA